MKAGRQLYGESLGDMNDIFRKMDKDGGGTVDVWEFRDGQCKISENILPPFVLGSAPWGFSNHLLAQAWHGSASV